MISLVFGEYVDAGAFSAKIRSRPVKSKEPSSDCENFDSNAAHTARALNSTKNVEGLSDGLQNHALKFDYSIAC